MAWTPTYTTDELLKYALIMLDEAREEQAKSRRKSKWLVGNVTLEVIRQRVAENDKRAAA